jgi:hypothetical protein
VADSERAALEMERLGDLVRRGDPLPPDQFPAVLRISPLRLAWDWLVCTVIVPAAIGLLVFRFSRSLYAALAVLTLIGALYSVRTAKDIWSKWNKRNDHFLLVTRLGFYKAEGESGGGVVLWSDVDRILRWQKEGADFVLVKLKQGEEVAFDAGSILYAGGISRLLETFHQLARLEA